MVKTKTAKQNFDLLLDLLHNQIATNQDIKTAKIKKKSSRDSKTHS
jgi:hypothetical protein